MSGLPAAASRTAAGRRREGGGTAARRQPDAIGTPAGRRARQARPRIPIARPSCHDVLMTDAQSPTQAFRNARDLLLRYREDYPAALAEFTWPQLDEFNWALDWFAVIPAEHPDRDALRIGADGDAAARISYAEMAARSSQVANWLRGLGARRGDRLLLMLGNIAPLWELILAALNIGVVIIPASTLLGPEDLADRVARGDVRHVVTEYSHTSRFAEVPGDWT